MTLETAILFGKYRAGELNLNEEEQCMKQYKIRWEVSIFDGLGYHLRDDFRYRVIEAVSRDQAKTVFNAVEPGKEIYDMEDL